MIISARRSYAVVERDETSYEVEERSEIETMNRVQTYAQRHGGDCRELAKLPFFDACQLVPTATVTVVEKHFRGILVHVREQDGREYMQILDES